MEEVLQKLTELINVLENNSVPLWLSIFGNRAYNYFRCRRYNYYHK